MKLHLTKSKKENQYKATNPEGHQSLFEYDDSKNIKSVLSPLEMLASSLGACMMVDMDSISKKQKQNISNLQIDIDVDRQAVEQHTEFKKINVHIKLTGKQISPKKVEKAINLTTEKYCSVYKMLSKTIPIEVDFSIIDEK